MTLYIKNLKVLKTVMKPAMTSVKQLHLKNKIIMLMNLNKSK